MHEVIKYISDRNEVLEENGKLKMRSPSVMIADDSDEESLTADDSDDGRGELKTNDLRRSSRTSALNRKKVPYESLSGPSSSEYSVSRERSRDRNRNKNKNKNKNKNENKNKNKNKNENKNKNKNENKTKNCRKSNYYLIKNIETQKVYPMKLTKTILKARQECRVIKNTQLLTVLSFKDIIQSYFHSDLCRRFIEDARRARYMHHLSNNSKMFTVKIFILN